jgi:hypothetical protein
MKIAELNRVNEARQEKKYQRVLDEVNRIYMANRDEFETTTVCSQDGVVRYIRGVRPRSEIPFVPAEVPAWKVRQMDARVRSYERAYKC